MARQLQGLIVFALCIRIAHGGAFSHALHLKLKADCTACHSQASASTRLQDNLLPTAAACTPCHRQVEIRAPSATRLKFFNHALHLKLGNVAPVIRAALASEAYLGNAEGRARQLETSNACAACHRGIEQANTTGKAHFPQMADCLVCHDHIDAPFSCEKCHGKDPSLKPASHTPDYLDAHTRKSVKTGCAECHGRRFTCLGCH